MSDAVEANILAATTDNDLVPGELFNVGTGKNYNIFDLVKMVGNDHVFIPPRQAEVRATLADTTKIKSLLGWEAKMGLEEWIKS